MDLSSEDALRLNVLIANAEAVRIDENTMEVYGLQGERELKATLHPTDRADKYLARVREMLSSAVLDSPGGYPVFLRRWTRMGQIDSGQLDRLLKLGEPEAVMAVVCSPGLTDELARRAWWCAPYSEYARRMLENPEVVQGEMGPVLAEFLIEHLPFETEHLEMLQTVRLVLQPGLVTEERRKRLWESGRSKKTYRVGFLVTLPDRLYDDTPARHDFEQFQPALESLQRQGNVYAELLDRLLDAEGQRFAATVVDAMRRPADQDVVSALFNAVGSYFGSGRKNPEQFREMVLIEEEVARLKGHDPQLSALLAAVPALESEITAMLTLAHIDEAILIPLFSRTDAVGTLMRKKMEPISIPFMNQFAILRGLTGVVR